MVSLGLGSDVPNLSAQNTWKLPDISSLHNVFKTGTFQNRKLQTFISSEDKFLARHGINPIQRFSASPIVRRLAEARSKGPLTRERKYWWS
jgi:hypothetical protein